MNDNHDPELRAMGDLAQRLQRELAEARAEIERWRDSNRRLRQEMECQALRANEQAAELAALRTEAEKGEEQPERPGEPNDFAGAISRMRAAESELAALREAIECALIHLATNIDVDGNPMKDSDAYHVLSAAIDAARKETK